MQNTHLNVWSKEKEEPEIGPTFATLKFVIFKPTISDSNMVGMASNFGDLIPHLRQVDASSLFEYWLSKTSDLRDVLSARFAAILEQSSFGRWIVWIVK